MRAKAIFSIFPVSMLVIGLTSCSSGPSGPEPGTPAFYWAAAKQSFSSGDYLKTTDNLDRAMKGSEYAAQALPWSLVVNAGLVKGYGDLANDYEQGARINRTNPSFFRRQASDSRRFARGLTLQLAEKFRDFQKTKEESVPLAFPFPSGSQAPPPMMAKVTSGVIPQESEVPDGQKQALSRAMILTTSDAVGAGEDSSKAASMFKAGDVKVPRPVFVAAMARSLYLCSDLYGPKKLDEPERAKMFAQIAMDSLKEVPESKDTKTLKEKLQKVLTPSKKGS